MKLYLTQRVWFNVMLRPGVVLEYLRAELSSEFLVLIVSSPKTKSPSSFVDWCIHFKRTKRCCLARKQHLTRLNHVAQFHVMIHKAFMVVIS